MIHRLYNTSQTLLMPILIVLKLPKDMFGFPVELKYLAAYQDFLAAHLSQSIKQYPKINDAE